MLDFRLRSAKSKEQRAIPESQKTRNPAFRLFGFPAVMFFALCFFAAYAQESKIGVDEASPAYAGVTDADKPNAEDRGVDADEQDRNARERRPRRLQQGMPSNGVGDGQPRERPGGRLSPEVRQRIMEEENISPEDLRRDPEIRRRFRERVQRVLEESPEGFQPGGDRAGESQRSRREPSEDSPEGSQEARRGQRGASGPRVRGGEGLSRYVDVIVKKNLFLQLGSGGEEKRTSFALTAVISNTSNGSDSKAIIEKRGGAESYYVSEGDTFADEIEVLDIDEEIVKLNRSGEEEDLRLGEGTEAARRGGRRGSGRSGAPEGERRPEREREEPEDDSGQRGPGGINPDRLPEPVRRIMRERGISFEELQRNPELRDTFRREMQQRFGRGGADRRQSQPMRSERGRRRD